MPGPRLIPRVTGRGRHEAAVTQSGRTPAFLAWTRGEEGGWSVPGFSSLSGSTNVPALNAWRYLNSYTNALARSTERLASGLRINRASDDPTGLIIANRYAMQRRGLQTAASNIQQGVSMLQTAESALSTITELVQQIREEALAASSATSQSARNAAQSTIEGLLADIDRTAAQATFGERQLLDGSLTALVSTDSPLLTAALRGTPVEGGEYRVELTTAPGAGQVLTSAPLTLLSTGNTQYASGTRGRSLDVSQDLLTYGSGNPALAEDDFTRWVNHEFTTITWGATGNTANRDFRLATEQIPGGGDDVYAVTAYNVADDSVGAHSGFAISHAGGAMPSGARGYMRVELTAVAGTGTTPTTIQLDGAGTQTATLKVTKVAENGAELVGYITLTGTQLIANQDVPRLVAQAGYTNMYSDVDSQARIDFGAVGETWTVGDTLLFTLDPKATFSAGDETIRVLREAPGRDDFPAADTTGASLSGGAPYQPTRVGLRSLAGTNVSYLDGQEVSVSVPYLDASKAAQVGTGMFRFGSLGDTVQASPRAVQFNLHSSTAAERVTFLRNVAEFASGGSSVFDSGDQTMNIHSGGNVASLSFGGADTLEEAVQSIRDAIRRSVSAGGLGMGVDGNLARSSGVDANLAVLVDDPSETGAESVLSTLVLRSPVPGPDGRFAFSGSGDLVGGLGFTEYLTPSFSTFGATVSNARTGAPVGTATTNAGVFRGLPAGIDLYIDPSAEIDVGWDNANKEFTFSSDPGVKTFGLHVAPNLLNLHVGPNAGDTFATPVAQVDTQTLGLAGMLVVDRDYANEALVRADRALDFIGVEQAKIGGYVSRLHNAESLNDLVTAYVSSAEDNVRNVDAAKEMIDWMNYQLGVHQAGAMLAQANVNPTLVWQLLVTPLMG